MGDIGNVPGRRRRGNIVVGGKQSIVRIMVNETGLHSLSSMLWSVFPPARGHKVKLAYAIPGTRPKEFKTVKCDDELKAFLSQRPKSELYVTLDRQANVKRSRCIPRRNDTR